MVQKKSKEFEERTKLQEQQKASDLARHKNVMIELAYKRENEEIYHDHEMTRQRIKSAEIRKQQERRHLAEMQRAKYPHG